MPNMMKMDSLAVVSKFLPNKNGKNSGSLLKQKLKKILTHLIKQ